MTKYLISIVGPTAIGKTALSIQLAQHFNTEIISADSRQFFKEMAIGTAVPSTEELASATHHFIHHKSITNHYNVGDFERDAIALLDKKFHDQSVIIMVGGSGLYVDAVTNGLDEFPEIDKSIRQSLNKQLERDGLTSLQKQLKILDETSYNTIKIDNPHRVIRALEICIGTGAPYASFLNKSKKKRSFKTIKIGLTAERELIYSRINQRVDTMIAQGLVNEVTSLYKYKSENALNTVGYKELFAYLDGACSLEVAIAEIKKNTRRFAKRQLTWFNKDKSIKWFAFDTPTALITDYVNTEMLP